MKKKKQELGKEILTMEVTNTRKGKEKDEEIIRKYEKKMTEDQKCEEATES